MVKIYMISLLAATTCQFSVLPASALTPNDPDLEEQWYLNQVQAYEAWDVSTGNEEIVVAVLDTGLDLDHPDIVDNLWENIGEVPGDGIDNDGNGFIDDVHGWDFTDDNGDPEPKIGSEYSYAGSTHGTVVASVIGAVGDNSEGIAGINWEVKLMPVRILDELGSGLSSDASRAVNYAVANGADVINLSFSGFEPDGSLREAIRSAYFAGVVVVAAVGNNSDNGGDNLEVTPIFPACYEGEAKDWVVGVAATDENDNKADFSNYGPCVDISAPGIDIYGASLQDETQIDFQDFYAGGWQGTSAAAPMVAGAAALVKAVEPELDAQAIINVLQLSADPVAIGTDFAGQMGAGRLNLSRALEIAGSFSAEYETPTADPSWLIYTAPAADAEPLVTPYYATSYTEPSFYGYAETFSSGVRLASGDIDGDGEDEVVVGAGPGGGPQIRLFESDGTLVDQWFAFDESGRTGVFVATGDVNRDGVDEILVTEDVGGTGRVKMFTKEGAELGTIKAFEIGQLGVRVATADVDGDGVDEIVTGLGSGNKPRVRVFEPTGYFLGEFDAYAETYNKGIFVAGGDVNGDGVDEIVTGTDVGGGPHVRVFTGSGVLDYDFFAYNEAFRGGVRVAVGDMTGDGIAEIITAAGPGGGPHVRVWDHTEVVGQFFAEDEAYSGGVNLAVWDW